MGVRVVVPSDAGVGGGVALSFSALGFGGILRVVPVGVRREWIVRFFDGGGHVFLSVGPPGF